MKNEARKRELELSSVLAILNGIWGHLFIRILRRGFSGGGRGVLSLYFTSHTPTLLRRGTGQVGLVVTLKFTAPTGMVDEWFIYFHFVRMRW